MSYKEIILKNDNFEDLSNKILKIITDEYRDFNEIAFIGKYSDVKQFLSVFTHITKVNIEHIELFDDHIYRYKDEYLVSISNYEEICLYCEKFKVESSDKYKFSDADTVFIMEDCSCKALEGVSCSEDRIFICILDDETQIDDVVECDDEEGVHKDCCWHDEHGHYYSVSIYSDDKEWVNNFAVGGFHA